MSQAIEVPKMMTVQEVAEILNCHPGTVRNRIKAKQIQAKKMGHRVLITSDEVNRYIESLPDAVDVLHQAA